MPPSTLHLQEDDESNDETNAAATTAESVFLEHKERIQEVQIDPKALKEIRTNRIRQVRVRVRCAAALASRPQNGISTRDELD